MTSTAEEGTAQPGNRTGADDPVLMSKITAPGPPDWAVRRPRIEKLIAEGAQGPLTVVSGPPGAGKTMAIALWAAASYPGRLAWISLDGYDNQPRAFWSHVAAALRLTGLEIPRVPAATGRGTGIDHVFLQRLASALAAQDPPVVMVLDDLHLLAEPATLDGLDYVLKNARAGLRLLVSSRMDPLLPLHRYRLSGELTEIRADDLAFSIPESSLLLAHHGISLPTAAMERLTGRTEGWAAGLRLAALSLDGHPDPEQFIKELDAEESAITGYLVNEVLNAQSSSVRDLLLRTSILDCVSADLADELTDDQQAPDTLAALARANAFVQPLGHGWYRYHSLFAAVLRLKLRSECPARVPGLHRRAARWHQRNGRLTDAVRHAAACGDWTFAAGIVIDELAIGQLIDPRDDQPLAVTFRGMLPDPASVQPGQLLVTAAMELSDAAGDLGSASLAAAQSILERLPAGEQIPARLSGALIQLAQSRRTGDLDAAAAAAARAQALLDELPEGLRARHPGIRAQILSGRGAVELWTDRVDEAVGAFRAGVAAARTADSRYERADCLGYLALVAVLRGRLSHAVELIGQAGEATESIGGGLARQLPVAATVALASVYTERNEVQRAHGQLKLADATLRVSPDRLISAVACLTAAQRSLAGGHATAVVDMVRGARQGWTPPGWLELRLALLESRACAASGDIQGAVAAAAGVGRWSAPDAAVALACAWLAAGDHQAARRALDAAAEVSGDTASQASLAGWLADAWLSYATGDSARGRRSFEHALRLGKPEQLRLPFALDRSWIRPVLRRDPDLANSYRELLEPELAESAAGAGSSRPGVAGQAAPLIIEPLSMREREVLDHLSGMLSTAEIATEMYISVNTVKTHLRSIYRKLSAAHRGEAVRRARQLELIGSRVTAGRRKSRPGDRA